MGCFVLLLSVFLLPSFNSAITSHALSAVNSSNITATQLLKDAQSLLSSNDIFELGFFAPPNSTNRYVGIWYANTLPKTDTVWVANRNTPLKDSSGVLSISSDGNLRVLDGGNRTLWSSGITSSTSQSTALVAGILNSGNLVLRGGTGSKTILWQSFDHPTDTFLPDMKLSFTATTNLTFLRSWRSPSDPSSGEFSLGIDSFSISQLVIRDGHGSPRWRSGPWNGNMFVGVEDDIQQHGNGFILATDRRSTMSLSFSYSDDEFFFSKYVLSSDGNLILKWWDGDKRSWEIGWQALQNECDGYGYCGPFASCNSGDSPVCSCFKGFIPKNKVEWGKQIWTDGCVRRKELLQCGNSSSSSSSNSEEGDGFWRMELVKVPDKADWQLGLDENECESYCLRNCTCMAYMYDTGSGCLSWNGELVDTVVLGNGNGDGSNLNIRLARSELGTKGNNNKKIFAVVFGVLVGASVAFALSFLLWRYWVRRQQGAEKQQNRQSNISVDDTKKEEEIQVEELPLFKLEELLKATDNLSPLRKLAEGGFGPVYRGVLEDGREIAVKRLSSGSGQGFEEFMNEVSVISKLQHRNLVRLLGCCVEGVAKMLVYEYLQSGSLAAMLFNPERKRCLTWKKRCDIIYGICRGLLYLHRDSRLKIIHRDLKPSNILLDEHLNPKISDFGLAKISGGGQQDQENTRRVVGTFGYMAPEYAMEGKFSEKSDVFSFGVMLLEIVSGIKNTSFWYEEESTLSLLGYAWKLWDEEENITSLIDSTMLDAFTQGKKIVKFIQVGLMCVQEYAEDRPSISRVMKFLANEGTDIPKPKPPGLMLRQNLFSSGEGSSAQQQIQSGWSEHEMCTVSILSGR